MACLARCAPPTGRWAGVVVVIQLKLMHCAPHSRSHAAGGELAGHTACPTFTRHAPLPVPGAAGGGCALPGPLRRHFCPAARQRGEPAALHVRMLCSQRPAVPAGPAVLSTMHGTCLPLDFSSCSGTLAPARVPHCRRPPPQVLGAGFVPYLVPCVGITQVSLRAQIQQQQQLGRAGVTCLSSLE